MSTQTQKETTSTASDFVAEDQETEHFAHGHRKKGTLRDNRAVRIVLTVVLCALFFVSGMFLSSRLNDPFLKPAKSGYLSLNEYVLTDSEGNPVQESSVSQFQDKYTFTFDVFDYSTSRGISAGDSWEKFVSAYGDVYAYEILCDDQRIETEKPITVSAFQSDYIDAGRIDPNQSEIEIRFMTGTDGTGLCYSDHEIMKAADQLDSTPSLLKRIDSRTIRVGRFTLSFVFSPAEEGSSVDFIYSGFDQQ